MASGHKMLLADEAYCPTVNAQWLTTSHVPATYKTIKRCYCSIGWPYDSSGDLWLLTQVWGGDLSLEFVYHGQKDNPVKPGQTVTGLDARLTLDRLEYNVGDGKFYKMGVVDKDVDIMITLEMLR